MRKAEVIKKIGKENWTSFNKFMFGQTVGIYSDGEINYYECDVNNFLRKPKDRFFD